MRHGQGGQGLVGIRNESHERNKVASASATCKETQRLYNVADYSPGLLSTNKY